MTAPNLAYEMTFRDFQFLQSHMARRVFAKNRSRYGPALAGVVLCALLLTMVIVLNVNPYRRSTLFGLRYPYSYYLQLIIYLVGAIAALIPAINLRLKTLRMQVSDNSALFGPTTVTIEPDGLVVDRRLMTTKYLWAAFQSIEISKNAIILPIENGIGLIVPASAFASDTERYDFAALVSKRLSGAAPASN